MSERQQPLFDHMAENHDLTLLESEMFDIEDVVNQINEEELRIEIDGTTIVASPRAWFNSIKRENGYLEKIEKLKKYASHTTMCSYYDNNKKICNCGLKELL